MRVIAIYLESRYAIMKKKFSAVNILLLVLFLICGCSAAEKGNVSSNDTQPSVETWATEHGLRQMASAVTDKLTLEEKIGQMMFVGTAIHDKITHVASCFFLHRRPDTLSLYGNHKKHTFLYACRRRHPV